MKSSSKSVVIIGAGIGGLAIANLLAKKGWQVDVYEQHDTVGGRAGLLEVEGFRFDTGPSWYLMPEVFEHYFGLLGERVDDYLDLIRLDPAYKVFYDYHKPITIHADEIRDTKLFDSVEPGSGNVLRRYIERAGRTYHTSLRYFLYNPFTHLNNFTDSSLLKELPFVISVLLRPMHSYVAKFFHSKPLQQIMEYQMVFLGASPFKAPALFHLMSYLDFKQGVFYPQGGMYTIIDSLHKIGLKYGVRYHLGVPVTSIITTAGRAAGIVVGGKEVTADIVISNADLHFTETQLVPLKYRSYPEKYWTKKVAGPSALLMYLGVKGQLPDLEHHNLLFVERWRQNFDDIFEFKQWPDEASIYVSRSSVTDPAAAPAGHENIFVLVPLPANPDVSDDYVAKMTERYLDQIAKMLNIPDLRSRLVYKRVFGPKDFVSNFNAWNATALGMSHLLTQSAFFRPGSRSKKLKGLYYVGAGVQPGIGLPMCLINAEVLYKMLAGDHSNGPLTELIDPKDGSWHV